MTPRRGVEPGSWSAIVVLVTALSAGSAAAQSDVVAFANGAPLVCAQPEARAFDFWIGDWDVVNRNRRSGDSEFGVTGRATDRVYAVVGGCGIVEHWRGDAFSRFIVGFSVRAYDPALRDWRLVLLWPITGPTSFLELRGTFHHGRGEFFTRRIQSTTDTVVTRFTFSDATPQSLRWENATSLDNGISWSGDWIMDFTRRNPVADAGLLNGPSMTDLRCPAAEHRRFDEHLGDWTGMRISAAGDSAPLRVRVTRILEGCAVMEHSATTDGSWDAFRVRAWDTVAERWVEYALDSDRPVLMRREGTPSAPLLLQDVSSHNGLVTRTRWLSNESDTPGWVVEAADGPDGPWRRHSTVRLDRRPAALEPIPVPST